jgi:hypothetical protein
VLGHNCLHFLVLPVMLFIPPAVFADVLAYAGPGTGMELIPYFMGLLAWIGTAFGAVILWPIVAFFRRFRKPKADPQHEVTMEPNPVKLPESQQ